MENLRKTTQNEPQGWALCLRADHAFACGCSAVFVVAPGLIDMGSFLNGGSFFLQMYWAPNRA